MPEADPSNGTRGAMQWTRSFAQRTRRKLLELLEDFPSHPMLISELHTCRVSGGPVEREHHYRGPTRTTRLGRLNAL